MHTSGVRPLPFVSRGVRPTGRHPSSRRRPRRSTTAFFRDIVVEHAERRARHDPRRHARRHERRGVPDLRRCRREPSDIGPAAMRRCCATHPDVVRVLAGAFELSHLPNRAEMRLKSTGQGHRLHAVASCATSDGATDRRGAVLQGPDAGRAARRTRAAARSAGGARRDGGRDRARGEEPARRASRSWPGCCGARCPTRRTRSRS